MGEKIETIDEIIGKLNAITTDDINQMAKRIFRMDDASLSIIGRIDDDVNVKDLLQK
jgi:predicted Zn-dependent peptidase